MRAMILVGILVLSVGCELEESQYGLGTNSPVYTDAGSQKKSQSDSGAVSEDGGNVKSDISAKIDTKPVNPMAKDEDGDGYRADVDCNDSDRNIHPNAQELCNNVDDDCDGKVDDNPKGVGELCGSKVGECRQGKKICQNGGLVCSGETVPKNELCDGKDNDCDGKVDEDWTLGGACSSGAGFCLRYGKTVCDASGTKAVCDAIPGQPEIEGPPGSDSCKDNEDNDCDGKTDLQDPNCIFCVNDKICDDGNPCTSDSCVGGICENKPLKDETLCSDGKMCNGVEKCDSGVCKAGAKPTCDDGNQCTTDYCDISSDKCVNTWTASGKEGTPGSSSCKDGLDNDCDSYIDLLDADCRECTVDKDCGSVCKRCNTSTWQCENKSDNTSCDDNDKCNGEETCQSGKCQRETPPNCDDNKACTDDRCDSKIGCINKLISGCKSCSSVRDCNDNNPCTLDKCDNGKCESSELADGTSCDDGKFCTTNQCMSGSCKASPRNCSNLDDKCNIGKCYEDLKQCKKMPKANGTSCSNGLYCDGHESCSNGECKAGTPIKCDDQNVCTRNVCNEDLDKCEFPLNPISGAENYKLLGTCSDGKDNDCDGKTDYSDPDCQECEVHSDCNDKNSCTINKCENYKCKTTYADGLSCDDNKFCTEDTKCSGGSCTGGKAKDCSSENDQCNTGKCDESSKQCKKMPKTNGTTCDDGLFCKVGDKCQNGSCVASGNKDCSDGNSSTTDTCNETYDRCEHEVYKECTSDSGCPSTGNVCTKKVCDTSTWKCVLTNVSGSCDDGEFCTINDTCSGGQCTGGSQRDCGKNYTCNETLNKCEYTYKECSQDSDCGGQCKKCNTSNWKCEDKSNGTSCDDGKFCTIGEYCSYGTCTGGTQRNCEYGYTCYEEYDECRYGQQTSSSGCADGQREGFTDENQFPLIAGCSGAWQIAGLSSTKSNYGCWNSGDDGSNTSGYNCRAADLCAYGWHICNSEYDIKQHLPWNKSCQDAVSGGEKLFFASLQSGPGDGKCGNGSNDIFGCGSIGHPPATNGSCGVINAFSSEDCIAFNTSIWQCSGSGDTQNEKEIVVKRTVDQGGVLCCKD